MNALVIAFFAVVAIVAAAPNSPPAPPAPVKPDHEKPIAIIVQESDMQPDGGYKFRTETENGIKTVEEGVVKVVDKGESILAVQGTNSWTAPDGTLIENKYTADETGYHVEGAHLPTTPPTPEYVAKALKWNEEHPEEEKEESLPKP